jgi:hypothetical protein
MLFIGAITPDSFSVLVSAILSGLPYEVDELHVK